MSIDIFLLTPPEFAAEAARTGSVALLAYRLGAGFHLYRTELPKTRFEHIFIDCAGFTGRGPHQLLSGEIVGECLTRRCRGAVLDISPRATPELSAFAGTLSERMEAAGLALYLPGGYAPAAPASRLVFETDPLRGSLREQLLRLTGKYGDKVTLTLPADPVDFELPTLSRRRFTHIRSGATPFYSKYHALQTASYIENGRAHVMLWDDARSISDKLSAAEELGVGSAIIYYPYIRGRGGKFLKFPIDNGK